MSNSESINPDNILNDFEKEFFSGLAKVLDDIPLVLLPSVIPIICKVFKKIVKLYSDKANDELKRQSELIMDNFLDFVKNTVFYEE